MPRDVSQKQCSAKKKKNTFFIWGTGHVWVLLLNFIISKLGEQDIIAPILGEEIEIWRDFVQDYRAIA